MSGKESAEDYIVVRERRAAQAHKDREVADGLWRQLQASGPPRAWKHRVLEDPALLDWALCERICDESLELAELDPEGAEELASLAVEMAPKVPGDPALVCGAQEYAWTHLANACRARGDLASALEAFRRAESFFVGAMAGIWPNWFRRQRMTVVTARLLIEQGKLAEAMEKIEFDLQFRPVGATADRGEGQALLLLEKGRLHRSRAQTGRAVEDLTRSGEIALKLANPHLSLRIAIDLGSALCDAGRAAEVKAVPGALRSRAEGREPARSRLLCLDGRVAVGLGRVKEAEAVLMRDPAEFHPKAIPELVLLFMETAVLQLRKGHTAKLKRLAESTAWLRESPGLGREAAASLKLFCRLVAQDKMSTDRAAQFAAEIVRHVPAA
jgi:tetratricopeptide (TPR) repeat protein